MPIGGTTEALLRIVRAVIAISCPIGRTQLSVRVYDLTLLTDMLILLGVNPVLTVAEVAKLLRMLEGRFGLTPRGIRYYARTGMVEPSARTAEGRHARLYTLEDVVLLRLVCRLKRLRVHERAIWGFLVYRGEELRQKIRDDRAGVLVFDDPVTLSVAQESAKPRAITIALPDFVAAIETRIASYRQRNPELWTGTAWIPAHELAQVSA